MLQASSGTQKPGTVRSMRPRLVLSICAVTFLSACGGSRSEDSASDEAGDTTTDSSGDASSSSDAEVGDTLGDSSDSGSDTDADTDDTTDTGEEGPVCGNMVVDA